MGEATTHFTTVLISFFAMMNPIANTPLFLGVTEGVDSGTRRGIALQSVIIAFVIVALFTISGRQIFHVFGITLPAFRIAGGVLIGIVGYHLLQGLDSSIHTPTSEDNSRSRDAALGVAITPLALPVLAGPGTIATALNFAAESTLPAVTRVLAALAVVCLLTLGAFLAGDSLVRFLGQNAIKVVSRLMGLILAVIGVQMLIEGVTGAITAASSP